MDKLSLAHINANGNQRAIEWTSFFTHVYFLKVYISEKIYTQLQVKNSNTDNERMGNSENTHTSHYHRRKTSTDQKALSSW